MSASRSYESDASVDTTNELLTCCYCLLPWSFSVYMACLWCFSFCCPDPWVIMMMASYLSGRPRGPTCLSRTTMPSKCTITPEPAMIPSRLSLLATAESSGSFVLLSPSSLCSPLAAPLNTLLPSHQQSNLPFFPSPTLANPHPHPIRNTGLGTHSLPPEQRFRLLHNPLASIHSSLARATFS